jgi:hypothetical protein
MDRQGGGARVVSVGRPRRPGRRAQRRRQLAKGNVIWFVDADVVVHPEGARVLKDAFERTKAAAVFGTYDEFPAATNFLSQYKNLAHRHHHVRSGRERETFFAGCGAVRAAAFRAVGGFDAKRYPKPSIEDIELGVRLRRRGFTIRLEPDLQARHLKSWHFGDMVRTDILQRTVPTCACSATTACPMRCGCRTSSGCARPWRGHSSSPRSCSEWACRAGGFRSRCSPRRSRSTST